MKIQLNETKKELELIKNDGTVISTYSYKNVINDTDFTIDDLKRNNDKFNKTLSLYDEFNSIKDLAQVLKVHNFDE